MSLRKSKFIQKDKLFMNLALNLARDRLGLTGENPSVGCVIVKNDEVISIGQTGINGRPHAEYNAVKSCKKNINGSKMYVSLEPCTHFGKTPPCSNIIISSKIKEVIFPLEDPETLITANSLESELRVTVPELEKLPPIVIEPLFSIVKVFPLETVTF